MSYTGEASAATRWRMQLLASVCGDDSASRRFRLEIVLGRERGERLMFGVPKYWRLVCAVSSV